MATEHYWKAVPYDEVPTRHRRRMLDRAYEMARQEGFITRALSSTT